MLLSNILSAYRRTSPLEDSSFEQLKNVVGLVTKFAGEAVDSRLFFEPERFHDWVQWLRVTPDRNGRIRTGRTINGRVSTALTLWRWARDAGHTAHPCPRIKRMPELREPPTAWSLEEMQAILEHVGHAPRIDGWSPAHWRALLLTFWDVAARVDALLACQTYDVDRGMLHLRSNLDKESKGSWRKLSAETLAALDALPREPGDDRLFPWPRQIDALRRHFRRILKSAGLGTTRRDLFHKLRRTTATQIVIATGRSEDAQRVLNHASVTTTIRNYLDPRKLPAVEAADVLPRLR